MEILVLGIGNLVMSDDGIGVRAVQALAERYRFPDAVTVLDGGTLGLDLLPRVGEGPPDVHTPHTAPLSSSNG